MVRPAARERRPDGGSARGASRLAVLTSASCQGRGSLHLLEERHDRSSVRRRLRARRTLPGRANAVRSRTPCGGRTAVGSSTRRRLIAALGARRTPDGGSRGPSRRPPARRALGRRIPGPRCTECATHPVSSAAAPRRSSAPSRWPDATARPGTCWRARRSCPATSAAATWGCSRRVFCPRGGARERPPLRGESVVCGGESGEGGTRYPHGDRRALR